MPYKELIPLRLWKLCPVYPNCSKNGRGAYPPPILSHPTPSQPSLFLTPPPYLKTKTANSFFVSNVSCQKRNTSRDQNSSAIDDIPPPPLPLPHFFSSLPSSLPEACSFITVNARENLLLMKKKTNNYCIVDEAVESKPQGRQRPLCVPLVGSCSLLPTVV